jgi:hypothetical protein
VLTDEQWSEQIQAAQQAVITLTKAKTFLRGWTSDSKPVAMLCDNGDTYILKGKQSGDPSKAHLPRVMATEQVVGRIGARLGTPTPTVAQIELEADLVAAEPKIAHLDPGVLHGSRNIDEPCSDRLGVDAPGSQRNREAYGSLSVLYGWMGTNDVQLIRTLSPPADVYSVDHGHFFAGGPNWSAASLANPGVAEPDRGFIDADTASQSQALAIARSITDSDLAAVVGGIPAGWGLPLDDLIALGKYLSARRDTL